MFTNPIINYFKCNTLKLIHNPLHYKEESLENNYIPMIGIAETENKLGYHLLIRAKLLDSTVALKRLIVQPLLCEQF